MLITDQSELTRCCEAALESLTTLLAEDGAQLRIRRIDPDVPSVDLALELTGANCEECVMPPDALRSTIAASLLRDTGVTVAVMLDDPRETGDTASAGGDRVYRFAVLDPTGLAPDDGIANPGPDAGPLAGKTVVIRHDVLWPAFDWTVEEWQRLLGEAGATVHMFARAQGQKDDVLAAADAHYESLLAGADLVISGLGNCGSCTSWSVRDAIIAANKGLTTSVVATAHFAELAKLLAAEGGRPGMRITVLPYPYSTLDEGTVRNHARNEYAQLLSVLGAVA